MGNHLSCSGGGQEAPVAPLYVTELLSMVALEEKRRRVTLPVADWSAPHESELPGELLALGVEMGDATMPDAVRCWNYLAEEDFWRTHHDLHPRKKRVKAWLFVHGKFRARATSLIRAADAMQDGVAQGCSSSSTETATRSMERGLKSLLGKVAKHSDFEDTQLFRFFKENVPDSVDAMRDLEADHSDKQLEIDAVENLRVLQMAPTTAAGTSSGADVALAAAAVAALKAYVASLEEHLDREERAIVGRWLNLDEEMYAGYRTYLVGRYRLIY